MTPRGGSSSYGGLLVIAVEAQSNSLLASCYRY